MLPVVIWDWDAVSVVFHFDLDSTYTNCKNNILIQKFFKMKLQELLVFYFTLFGFFNFFFNKNEQEIT